MVSFSRYLTVCVAYQPPLVYGVKLDSRILDNMFYVFDRSVVSVSIVICFIAFLMNRYSNRLLPLLRQFPLNPDLINKLMDLTTNCSTPYFKQLYWYLFKTWLFVTFHLSNRQLTPKVLGSGTGVSAVCVCVCLKSITARNLKS